MYVTSSFFSLLSVVYLLDSAGRLIGVRRCMDAVVITYLTDGFPHVSYFTDLSFYFTPHAGLGYDMNNIRIKQLIVDSEGLVTMFSLCLMDLSYLILKETTADHRTVRTQHIVETTHNDDEF